MLADELRLDPHTFVAMRNREGKAIGPETGNLRCPEVGTLTTPIGHHPCAGPTGHGANMGIISVQNRDAALRQTFHQLSLFERRGFEAAIVLVVIATDGGHDSNLWLDEPQSAGNFPRLVCLKLLDKKSGGSVDYLKRFCNFPWVRPLSPLARSHRRENGR